MSDRAEDVAGRGSGYWSPRPATYGCLLLILFQPFTDLARGRLIREQQLHERAQDVLPGDPSAAEAASSLATPLIQVRMPRRAHVHCAPNRPRPTLRTL